MARLVGYLANQTDRLRCALALDGGPLAAAPDARLDGWGVGSYQGGEVLLRRRPADARLELPLAELVRDLRTDCAIVHVRRATNGGRTLDNTHPFRYRHYLFAHVGSVPEFRALRGAIAERVPDFLLRTVRGETDSELFFALTLAQVFATGRLDDTELDRRALASALGQAVAVLDELADAAGAPRASLNAVLTNHHALAALRRGMPMSWLKRQGIRDCAVCRKQPDVTGREPKRMDHEQLRYVLVAAGEEAPQGAGWYDLPDAPRGALLTVDRSLDAQVTEL